jgi:sterol 24-C-methyltransferase
MSAEEKEPLLNANPTLQKYYGSLESRIGYRLLLGDTRHFGYYTSPSSWPFPINGALRAMEEQLFNALECPPGSRLLDAGCGVGHVAIHMARAGDYRIECIDVVARHVAKAKRNISNAGMEAAISARLGDYHHLEDFQDNSFDGIYTMETLVHSTDPLGVLREFLRLLKPGGRITLNEYDHDDSEKAPKGLADSMKKVNKYAAMPANASFDRDVLKELIQEAGFEDVHLRDLSEHIVPMLWLFYLLAIIPYILFKLLGIEHCFVNTMAGVESYRGRHLWRYIQVTGKKRASSM